MAQRGITFVRAGEAPNSEKRRRSYPEDGSAGAGDSGAAIADFYRTLVLPTASQEQKLDASSPANDNERKDAVTEAYWCAACELNVAAGETKQHQHGIAHLASRADYPPTPDPIVLNETNLGYRMMQRAGWRYEQGLGADEQGRRHPVRARMRPARLGVGAKQPRGDSGTVQQNTPANMGARQATQQAKEDGRAREELLAYLKR
ncbi:hypothetical protein THASP1DRAFT_29993 [Thamnocephalis sphaerospora]|uniref:G-patch domain-containing protein n=1 Tax=Thamnocephalis sphaerospora TaxID=78915 RepID=A0A4P9XQ86_9FUNG|nr:hypothetical protein THASP1DRAFT_29993 [Thamnocephalis sphaerospora]|eukprot:RKP08193.1 hypothetical protein THASP1DRAFT_29993 [Thamnocephalis sphaerospora]